MLQEHGSDRADPLDRPAGPGPGDPTVDLPAVGGVEPPPPLERGAPAVYAWMPAGPTAPEAAEPALAETALAESTAVGLTVSDTALAGTTRSEPGVSGPPVPDPSFSERVSLVKPRPPAAVSLVKTPPTTQANAPLVISYYSDAATDDDIGSSTVVAEPVSRSPLPSPSLLPSLLPSPTPVPSPSPRAAVPALSFVSQMLTIVAVLALGFLVQLTLFGSLQHQRDQAQAFSELRIRLAIGTAPVGPLAEDGKPLTGGTPVAILEIPKLGLREVVLEGSTSRVTMSGPGHRRDTAMPGQVGTSVIIGRRGGYGGPFAGIDRLIQGDEIVVTTGQGRHTYTVLGIRRAADPLPAPLQQIQGRITLTTTDGPTYQPRDVLRVDADLTSPAQLFPARIPTAALPENEAVMAGDSSALLTLVLTAPLLLAASAAVVWVRHRAGRWQSWIIGIPVLGLLGVIVIDTAAALLPNVL